MTALDIALGYIARGWNPVPIPYRAKAPADTGWQTRIVTRAMAPRYFNGSAMNIGVVLGPTSGGLTDVDLDCDEAIAIAAYVLPKTDAIFGRPSKRASHWLYATDLAVDSEVAALQFRHPTSKAMIVELRVGGAKGAQTVFPGSTHEQGEAITWEESGEPASVDGDDLRHRVRALAAYSLVAKHWPPDGARHHAALVLGGFLARAGKPVTEIKYLVEAIAKAANDKEPRNRRDAAKDAAEAYRAGKTAYGLPTMREMFSTEVANKVAEWLDYAERAHASDGEAPEVETPPPNDEPRVVPRLQWIDMSSWDHEPVPEREWAILNRVPNKQVGLFSGEGGTGKSIIELTKDVAHVIARDWLGSMPRLGPAMYIGAEDEKDELHRRLAAIANHHNVTFKELIEGGLRVLCLLGQDATLCALTKSGKVEVTNLYRSLYEEAGDIKPANISIDTLTRAFAGNEIDRVQVYAFAMHMQALAMVANGSVTVLSHPSLTGITTGTGISGSTAWHSAFRFRQYLKGVKADGGEQPDNDLRELEFKKNQYGPTAEAIALRYQRGLFLPVTAVGALDKAAEQAANDLFLKLLDRFTVQGRNTCDKKTAHSYAPTAFAATPEGKGKRKELADAMERLFNAGKIRVENYGRASRPASKIVRA
jgi:RecA-family ATPase